MISIRKGFTTCHFSGVRRSEIHPCSFCYDARLTSSASALDAWIRHHRRWACSKSKKGVDREIPGTVCYEPSKLVHFHPSPVRMDQSSIYIYIHISLYIYTHISIYIYIYIYIYICIGSRSFSEGFLRKPHHVRPEMSAAENREGMHHLPTVSFLHDIYCIYRHVYTHKVWIHTYPQ